MLKIYQSDPEEEGVILLRTLYQLAMRNNLQPLNLLEQIHTIVVIKSPSVVIGPIHQHKCSDSNLFLIQATCFDGQSLPSSGDIAKI